MKKKLSKMWALALACLATISCSKEEQFSGTPQPKTQWVNVEFRAETSQEDLRMVYNLKNDGTGLVDKIAMAEKDVNIYVGVKLGESGTPIYTTARFSKVTGEAYATYKGTLQIPTANAGERYYVTGILLSEVDGKEFARVSSSNANIVEYIPSDLKLVTASNQLDLNVPYIAPWTETTFDTSGNVLKLTVLKFAPQGTILRINVENKKDVNYPAKAIRFSTNAFVRTGYYDLSTLTSDGDYFLWKTNDATGSGYHNFILPDNYEYVAGKTSEYFYTWVMPTSPLYPVTMAQTFNDLVYSSTRERIFYSAAKLRKGQIAINGVIQTGSSLEGSFTIPGNGGTWESGATRPKLPIEYMAQYNTNSAGSFATIHTNNASGYFTLQDAYTQFKTVNISGTQYHLPTAAEWRGIFPTKRAFWETSTSVILEDGVTINGIDYQFSAQYLNGGDTGTHYALRLLGGDNSYRTAYRYRLLKDKSPISVITTKGELNTCLEITCRYLGESWTGQLSDLGTEAFWQDPSAEYITRTLPLPGYQDLSGVTQYLGEMGMYIGETMSPIIDPQIKSTVFYFGWLNGFFRANGTGPNNLGSYQSYTMAGANVTDAYKFPVRLFLDK